MKPGSKLLTVGREGLRSSSSNPMVTCNDSGEWSAPFPRFININECDEEKDVCSPRTTNQKCIDTIGGYKCVCQEGFVFLENNLCVPLSLMEKKCDIDALQTPTHCSAQADPLTNIRWESTPANCSSGWVNCPDGYVGKMVRFCNERGEWWDPYTTECKPENILDMIKNLPDLSVPSKTAQLLTDITLSMDTAYAGDVLLASALISDIIDGDPLASQDREDDKMAYLQSIVNLVSALLDAKTEPSWTQIHETRAIHLGAIALFDKLDRFGKTVHLYVGKVNKDIKLHSKNIGFEAYQVKSPTSDLVFPSKVKSAGKKSLQESSWYTVDEKGSTVVVPKENFVLQNSDKTTVIVFAYKNPANILPPGVKSGTNRHWVRTITGTKKIERVNSPVIAVNIYNGEESKHGKTLKAPLTFMLYHKEDGYKAKCMSMIYGNQMNIWNNDNCRKMDYNATRDFTECRCDGVGSVAIITTMGEMPTPFPEYALNSIILIANSLAAFLTAFTFAMLCLRRITTDHYFVCASLTLSLSMYFVTVVVALNMDRDTKSCAASARVYHYVLASSNAWVFNFCLQHFLKLRFCTRKNICARICYILLGWVIPLLLVLGCSLLWPAAMA
ncbi:latrophilin-like protein 1 [Ptychodera flava]|uniref:latrophilin-like protein 1 n=1 Tax=Ptychodera flava TaxID=63121 RepID=UPI00396A3A77